MSPSVLQIFRNSRVISKNQCIEEIYIGLDGYKEQYVYEIYLQIRHNIHKYIYTGIYIYIYIDICIHIYMHVCEYINLQ